MAHSLGTCVVTGAASRRRCESSVGIEARLTPSQVKDEAGWRRYAADWQALGATHLSIGTAGAGFTSLDAHLGAPRRVKEVLGG